MEGAGGIGGLLARSVGYSSGNWTSHAYYFADGNGNVTYMLNSSQVSVAAYRYDPFGNTIPSSGTLASANVYRFSSKEIHANSGMYYYGFRFYDPNLQRWISRDPIEEDGSLNLYAADQNDPITYFDPNGEAPATNPSQIPYQPPPPVSGHGPGKGLWVNPPANPGSGQGSAGCRTKADERKERNVKPVTYPCPGCENPNTFQTCEEGERCTDTGSVAGQTQMAWKHFQRNCTPCPPQGN